jgi:ribosome recycling factor
VSGEMAEVVLSETTDKMRRAVAHARGEFSSIRTGRAAPALVEKIPVDYYGSEVPLQQLAGFSVPEARQLLITPYDKGAMGAIEKAIQHSDLGLNPSNDGVTIRLSFPPLTQERRKELVKVVKHMAEEGKVALRNLRRAARHELEGLEKEGELSSDELARAEKELDRIIHSQEADIDQALLVMEPVLLEDCGAQRSGPRSDAAHRSGGRDGT